MVHRAQHFVEDPFEAGFSIGQQTALQAATQTSIEKHYYPGVARSERRFPFIRGALSIMAVGTLAFVALDAMTEVESVNTGTSSSIIDARSRHSVVVWSGQKLVTGDADHDVTGPARNPWSYSVGVVERQVEYNPQGAAEIRAIDDPQIGFYLFMTETKDGHDMDFDFSKISVTTPKPEPCPITVKDNEVRPKDYCTPLTSNDSRGLLSTQGWQGGPVQNDTSITADGRRALNVAINNTYCELGLVFGSPDIQRVLAGDSTGITQESVYKGVKNAVKAALRIDLSNQYGIPLTDGIGRPYILWADDVQLLKDIVTSKGKPLSEFTEAEFRSAATLHVQQISTGKIDPGPTYATEILDLKDKSKDINTPRQNPELTRDNAASSPWNFTCIPKAGTAQADALVKEVKTHMRVGSIGEAPSNAGPNGDGSFLLPSVANKMITDFKERIGK